MLDLHNFLQKKLHRTKYISILYTNNLTKKKVLIQGICTRAIQTEAKTELEYSSLCTNKNRNDSFEQETNHVHHITYKIVYIASSFLNP